MVRQGVASAIQKAITTCVDAFMAEIKEEDPERLDKLQAELEACLREALAKAVMAV